MPSSVKPALILFAHGARDPEWARPVMRVRDNVLAASPAAQVEVAFLEFMSPDLSTACAALVGEGATKITVVPLFIAAGGHLKKELPVMLEDLRAQHPGVEFELTPPVGESDSVVAAMACQAILSAGL
jgi:sirohydrochlorin cobaltochelatase